MYLWTNHQICNFLEGNMNSSISSGPVLVNIRNKGGEVVSDSKIAKGKGKWWQLMGHWLQILVEDMVKLWSQAMQRKKNCIFLNIAHAITNMQDFKLWNIFFKKSCFTTVSYGTHRVCICIVRLLLRIFYLWYVILNYIHFRHNEMTPRGKCSW